MAITRDDLMKEVRTTSKDEVELERCLAQAKAMIEKYIADNPLDDDADPIPPAIEDAAVLATAAEIFNQHKAPNGYLNQAYDANVGEGSPPVRISADPLRPAYSILGMWIMPVSIA